MGEQHENFIVAVRKREMLTASKVKISGSEKIANRNTTNKIFLSTIKRVIRKFHVATTTANKCTKKCHARAKLFFC